MMINIELPKKPADAYAQGWCESIDELIRLFEIQGKMFDLTDIIPWLQGQKDVQAALARALDAQDE